MAVHLAKGTRDYLPEVMRGRLAVTDRMRKVFEAHGFQPLETPAVERIETLTGKYGDEGSKLIFKILKRGAGGERGECDMALRYDLTVPLARVVAMNADLRMPFKRWQIAPVWRAERPARGRFREFVQCDADIVGSESPMAEAECLAVAADGLSALGFDDYLLRVNHRVLLRALARTVGAAERETELLVAIDKLDKIGRDGVTAELEGRGFAPEAIATVWGVLEGPRGDREATLAHIEAKLEGDDVRAATAWLRRVCTGAEALGVPPERLQIDPTLARGLDYYTGPVFEAVLTDGAIGSVAGGGRYDGLIGMFGKRQVPAVGISLGIERLMVVLQERQQAAQAPSSVDVTVTVVDDDHMTHAAHTARALRDAGLRVELVLEAGKLGKQFKHADALGSTWVVTVGPSEVADGVVAIKHLVSGDQDRVDLNAAIAAIQAARS